MNKTKRKLIILFLISLIIHLFIVHINKRYDFSTVILNRHSNLGVTLLKTGKLHNTLDLEPEILNKKNIILPKSIFDFNKIDFNNVDFSNSYPFFWRNPGYGILLSIIWKFTDVYNYNLIRLIQIIINCFVIFLIYFISHNITKNKKYALLSSLGYVLCLPVTFFATYPSEEIWGIWTFLLFIYFMTKPFNIKNMIISSFIIGLGSYFHELPHMFSKCFVPFIIIYVFIILNKESISIKNRFYYSALSGLLFFIIPIITLSPYIIRNYLVFDRYFETRFYGKTGDIINYYYLHKATNFIEAESSTHNLIKKINDSQNLNLKLNSIKYYESLNSFAENYFKNNPYIKLKNFYLNIPMFIKQRQFYGIENLFGFTDFMYNKRQEFKNYSTIDYIKANPFSFNAFLEYIKIFWDIFMIKLIGFFLLLFYSLKYNKNLPIIFFINVFIYLGNLYTHPEPKYHLISYLLIHCFIFTCTIIYIKDLISLKIKKEII